MKFDRAVRVGAVVALAVAALSVPRGAQAGPFTLTNGSADGQVTVGVDGFGSFGFAVGSNATDAFYNPFVGGTAGTTFESGVAIRFGDAGARQFLSSGLGSGLSNPVVTGSSTSGSSSFSFGGLNFTLVQVLTTLTTGSQLEQTYTITNPSATPVSFELVRYLDGDLQFDGGIVDGGGRLLGPETLFETDSATGSATDTTFLGIRGTGGTSPATNRYEVDSWSGLLARIINGSALDDIITGDGGDPDQFIDAGLGYDVTLALRNTFALGGNSSTTYTTTTIWGSGAPADGGGPTPPGVVPEPTSLLLLGTGIALVARRLRRAR